MSANVGKQEVRFKLAEAKSYNEAEINEAFAGVNFRKVGVLARPTKTGEPAKLDEPKN